MGHRFAFAALVVLSLLSPIRGEVEVDGEEDLQVIVDCLAATGQNNRFLRHMKRSGFQAILGEYLGKNPITLLIPTDAAFDNLPARLKGRLVGKDRIKFIMFHMLRELYPAAYIRGVRDTAPFETVMSDSSEGPFLYKCSLGDPDTICLSSQQDATNETVAAIVTPDACGLPTRTIGAQIIDSVLIPPNLFSDDVVTF